MKVEASAKGMFGSFTQAKSMDLSGLEVTSTTNMCEMFFDCDALTSLNVSGWNVYNVKDMFANTRSLERISLGTGLLVFHRDRRRETDIEEYVRAALAKLTVSFNKGAHEVTGKMPAQIYEFGAMKTLTKNVYTRPGCLFNGWKDLEGDTDIDEQPLGNDYFGRAVQNGEAPQKTLELIARWKVECGQKR